LVSRFAKPETKAKMQTQNISLGIAPAVVAAAIPIIQKAASIIAKVAPILGKVFNNRKAKEAKAKAGQYREASAELRQENQQLDQAIAELKQQGDGIAREMKANGLSGFNGFDSSVGGLGAFLWFGQKKKAEQQLKTAKEEYEELAAARDQKITTAQSMVEQLQALAARLAEGKNNNTILLIGGALAAAGLAYVAFKPKKKKAA
jgi:DNA repair exonuclease SbcCD ATPase subunit